MAKRPRDPNQLAAMIVGISTGEIEDTVQPESAKAKAGRLGGLKGGKVRADRLSSAEASAIAKKAAKTRWDNDASKK